MACGVLVRSTLFDHVEKCPNAVSLCEHLEHGENADAPIFTEKCGDGHAVQYFCGISIRINKSTTIATSWDKLESPGSICNSRRDGKGQVLPQKGQELWNLRWPFSCIMTVKRQKMASVWGDGSHITFQCDALPQPSEWYRRILPKVSQGSFFQEHMSRPVSKMAWSWRVPSFPINPDCHWQKLLKVWSAWWLIASPG